MEKREFDFCGVEKDIADVFPKRLKAVRMTAKLTQQQLADELGVAVATLSYYETGKRTPDIIFLAKLHDYFLIPVDYFLGNTDSMKEENTIISQRLGLSDVSIEKIQRFTDDYEECRDVLNQLLENDVFYSVLNLLSWCGYESETYMPDDDYINYIATRKMMDVISETINSEVCIAQRVRKQLIPENQKREKFYSWLSERGNQSIEEMKKEYEAVKKRIEDKCKADLKDFEESERLRTEALKNIKEAENNGKHNPTP